MLRLAPTGSRMNGGRNHGGTAESVEELQCSSSPSHTCTSLSQSEQVTRTYVRHEPALTARSVLMPPRPETLGNKRRTLQETGLIHHPFEATHHSSARPDVSLYPKRLDTIRFRRIGSDTLLPALGRACGGMGKSPRVFICGRQRREASPGEPAAHMKCGIKKTKSRTNSHGRSLRFSVRMVRPCPWKSPSSVTNLRF